MTTPRWAAQVGSRYRIVGEVYAYGVYESMEPPRTVTAITVTPLNIGGSELPWRRTIPKGEVFTVRSVWKRSALFDSGIYYRIEFDSFDLPKGLPIRLPLAIGNGSTGGDLNGSAFELLRDGQ